MASFKTVAKIAVVCWSKQGEEILTNELVEVVSLKDLIIKGKGTPQKGTDVSMQYKNELWEGKISSVHGKSCNVN